MADTSTDEQGQRPADEDAAANVKAAAEAGVNVETDANGVTKGYQKKLEVVGVGWNANLQGSKLVLNLGYAKPVELPVPAGVKASVERQIITLNSPDKQLVGQFAATIRSKRKPEPYNGKGVKYTDETIIRKEGKTVVGR